jgi:hypothetical protein
MGVKFKNNASSTLATAIAAGDVGLSVAYGDGSEYPTLGGSDYFYLTLEATDGTYEIVKVTARTGDAMTIVRAQEGTTALAFAAGTICALRVTAQGIVDKVAEDNLSANSVGLGDIETIAAARVLGSVAGGDVSELSLTNVLDLAGGTQGQVLYRGASAWSALNPGTAGQLLQTGGAGANPSWVTGVAVTDGDKGSITVSSSGAVWTLDDAAVTMAKLANLNRYELIGRSSSGAGVPQAVATSADVYAMLGAADDAAIRAAIGLDSMATQAAGAVAITGGSVTDLTSLNGTATASTTTSGTLVLADANDVIFMTGNITINGSVFSARQAFLFYAGASSRTITQGSSMTLRLGGTATTGDRTLAAYTVALGLVIDTNTVIIAGSGVT